MADGTATRAGTFALVAQLPVRVDGYELEGLEQATPAFVRKSTVVRLRGGGEEGVGEDVTYEVDEQERFQAAGPVLDLAGSYTLASLSERFDGLPDYRRWGFESAALDLALRQAGVPLFEALGREARPVTFVVSPSLRGEGAGRLRTLREGRPGLRFKLDPESFWDDALVAELAELDCVDVVDFKEAYTWREPERTAGVDVYRLVVDSLPDAWVEDPGLGDPEKAAVLGPYRDRITWDAVIHSVSDVDALPFPPRTLNSKPSRFGSVRRLFEFYDMCAERGIDLYGGGQFELGPGRGQIQYLASLFHPDASNDVAPTGFNTPSPPDSLPGSPLPAAPDTVGFRWLQN